MADYILKRASIGCVIASSLGDQDPEKDPRYANLPDDQFQKISDKMNATRDVYGFISILSFTWHLKNHVFIKQIYDYVHAKSEKYNSKHTQLCQILKSNNVGILVNERLINMPYDVVPDLHE
jgi:hypothetical protein